MRRVDARVWGRPAACLLLSCGVALTGAVALHVGWSGPHPAAVRSRAPAGAAGDGAHGPGVPVEALVSRALTPAGQPAGAAPPTRVRIGRIGVSAGVVALTPIADLTMPVPADPAVAGWYAGGPSPGDPGPAVLVGHLDSRSGPAVFWRLADLRPGDEVAVDRADGSEARFTVARVVRYPRAAFPSQEVYGPAAAPELRLITCGGVFNRLTGQYSDNVVVYATLAPGG